VSRKVRIIGLNDVQREQLTKGYQNGKAHVLRKRCHTVLLKGEGRTSKDISDITATVERLRSTTGSTVLGQKA